MSERNAAEALDTHRRDLPERPLLMNRHSGRLDGITSEFEDWLILADDEVKQDVALKLETDKMRDAERWRKQNKLSKEFSNSRLSRLSKDHTFAKQEVSQLEQSMGSVRQVSNQPPSEVSDLVSDMRVGLLEADHRRRCAKFAYDLVNFNINLERVNTQDVGQIQRLAGWAPVLNDYSNLE